MAYAKAHILGNMTRDPELRVTPGGKAVCNFTIAVNRKSGTGENAKEEVSFFDCTAFERSADNIAKFFTKGSPIFVEARPVQENWEDKTTKAKRSKIAFIVNEWQFAGQSKAQQGDQPSAPRSQAPAPQHAKPQENLDEDVPF